MKTLYILFFFMIVNCSKNEYNNIPYTQVYNNKKITDGLYPAEITYFDKDYNELKNLDAFKNVWIVVEDNEIKGIKFEKLHIPSKKTTHPKGKLQIIELPKVRFYQIKGIQDDEMYKFDFQNYL